LKNITVETFGEHFEKKDVFISCLGSTMGQAGSKAGYRAIDYGYNYDLSKIAKAQNVAMMSLLSSDMANKDSWFFATQVKGQLEHDIGELGFPHYSIFRAGLLGRGSDARFVEKFFGIFIKRLEVTELATAMFSDVVRKLNLPADATLDKDIYWNANIRKMSEEYRDKISKEEQK